MCVKGIQIALLFGCGPIQKQLNARAIKSRAAAEQKHGPCPENLAELAAKLERIFKRKQLTRFQSVHIAVATGCTVARARALCYWLARDKMYADYDKKSWSYFFIHRAD